MGAVMYREEGTVVKKGSFFSVVETGGMMHKALTASDGYYLFSDVGAGVKPLVLVGTWSEIGYFLTSQQKGVKNIRIGTRDAKSKENQDIWVSAGVYTPRQLKGLFPGHAFVQSLAEAAVSFAGAQVPSGAYSEFLERAGNVADAVGARKKLQSVEYYTVQRTPKVKRESPSVMYVRFNGFVESGATKLGTTKIKFRDHVMTILELMEPHVKS